MNTFAFCPGHSLLHRLDTRIKLLGLMLISTLSLQAGSRPLTVLSIVLIAFTVDCRLSLARLTGELRYFLLLLMLVFIARALSTPGEALWQWQGVAVTKTGLTIAALVCWRLLLIILAGLLLVTTTRTSQLTGAVQWYFRPVPFVDGARVALMLGLVVRFIPGLLLRVSETADAQRARCVENRKNPVYRMKVLVIPFLKNVFLEAEQLVQAMQARGYTGRRTLPAFTMGAGDWVALLFIVLMAFVLIL